jgi:hypothetical protein
LFKYAFIQKHEKQRNKTVLAGYDFAPLKTYIEQDIQERNYVVQRHPQEKYSSHDLVIEGVDSI